MVAVGFGLAGTAGRGVAAAEGADGADVLTAFVARTVKVYDVPLVRPDTVHEVALVVAHVLPSGAEVTA
jgi:pyruvate dehydrogenase complex dehydrogenase (E1) component